MKSYRLALCSALALSLLPAVALSACGSSSASPATHGDDDDDDGGSDGTDASLGGGGDASGQGDAPNHVAPPPDSSVDSMMDATMDAPPPLTDAEPDATAINCAEQADLTQVFVSAALGSDTSAHCQSSTPCRTLAEAFAVAATSGATEVYIDEGSYTELVTIPTTIRRIRGGWIDSGNNWTIDCTQGRLQATKIAAPGSSNMTIIAKDLGGTTSLESLFIQSKGTASAGESLYGIFATGATTTLNLIDTSVVTAAGGNGAMGGMGTPGAAPPGSCAAGTAAAASPSTPATVGGAQATYSVAGATVSSGPMGTIGGSGGNGAAGPAGQCAADTVMCEKDVDGCEEMDNGPVCAPNAAPGCGGGPGGVGGGGGGGGSSIALYAWDANVTVTSGTLQAGNGGTGGPGGPGGSGAGGSVSTETTTPADVQCNADCFPTRQYLHGAPGGTGASGADGVGGTGGAGGDSFGYYQNNNNVTIVGPDVTPGTAGTGGMGAATAPSGANGSAGTHNEHN